jgi:hypothetical protein
MLHRTFPGRSPSPGPFDYRRGIGLFKGVGKFDALLDVNLAAGLHAALPHLTDDITLCSAWARHFSTTASR